jgi:hypothetical protein
MLLKLFLGELWVAEHLQVVIAKLFERVVRSLNSVMNCRNIKLLRTAILAKLFLFFVINHEEYLFFAEDSQLDSLLD